MKSVNYVQFDPKSYCILSSGAFSKKTSGDIRFGELKVGILEDETSSEEQYSDGNFLVNYIEVAHFQLKSKGERDLEMAKTWPEKIKDFRKYIQKPHSHMGT